MTERDVIEEAIGYIREGYGSGCSDFEERCPSCRAQQTITFLEEHLTLLD